MMGGGFAMILVWLIPVLLIVWGAKWYLDTRERAEDPSQVALNILTKRYANGELSREDFDRMRAILTGQLGDTREEGG